jgi:hypothetical protein
MAMGELSTISAAGLPIHLNNASMPAQIFLGGACGDTTWRTDIAIPLLERAGISYFNPQLPPGAWTPDCQRAEMAAKDAATVWLFVINGATRGVASVAECAYRIGQGGRLALAMVDLPPGHSLGGGVLSQDETDDLNRGRIFLRAMAEQHGVPLFETVEAATGHAIELVRQAGREWTVQRLMGLLDRISLPGYDFVPEAADRHLTVRIEKTETNQQTGQAEAMAGRRWVVERNATEGEVVRTLLKAALTWEEHELRERFRLDGRLVGNPHFHVSGGLRPDRP